ncbi:G-protein coupled receptor Mth2 isoform X1 [Dendroctonus ponderosae]|nr:G-protein coupled receptor Mth2 isoform X1 [Dendroctonus ponderosae]
MNDPIGNKFKRSRHCHCVAFVQRFLLSYKGKTFKMFKYLLFPLSILLLNTWIVAGIFECCPGENNVIFLSNSSCGDKELNINATINLNCSIKIPLAREDWEEYGFIKVFDNGTILDNSMKETKYCHALDGDQPPNTNNSVYIFCYDPYWEDTFVLDMLHIQSFLILISATFVICTILVYFMVPRLLDLQGICMVHALIGLSASYIFLSVVQLARIPDYTTCTTLAFIIYLSFFYMFFWLAVLSFHIWRISVQPHLSEGTINWPLMYHIFAIGGTGLFLTIILIAHYSPSSIFDSIRPGFGERSCWFQSRSKIWIFFYGPIVVLLILNILLYVSTVVTLWPKVNSTRNKVLKYRVKLCLRLCVIMGITWSIEIFTFILNSDKSSTAGRIVVFILDLVNTLQGVLIFLILVVFRKRVRRELANKNLCNIKFPNSWKYLEDEEMDSAEQKTNGTILCYRPSEDVDAEI